LPLHRPRRIFRGSSLVAPAFVPGVGSGVLLLVLAGLVAAGAGVFVVPFDLPAALFRRAASPAGPAPTSLVAAEAPLVAVVDGDTLRLDETVVRLLGVAAPGRGRSCPDGTGAGYDCGAAASAALAALVRDRPVACRLSGRDRAGLAQGVCQANGTEINRALVAAGWARADSPGLDAAEATARAGRLGLWRNGANPGF
jgi:endonuclease YncB( thermonuclease family)